MVYRGIRLKAELEAIGCEVVEVYPYASKVRLFGKNMPPKTTLRGLTFLKQHISRRLPNISSFLDGFNHDMCDAVIAAYTAFLRCQGKTELCGDLDEGVICLPLWTLPPRVAVLKLSAEEGERGILCHFMNTAAIITLA